MSASSTSSLAASASPSQAAASPAGGITRLEIATKPGLTDALATATAAQLAAVLGRTPVLRTRKLYHLDLGLDPAWLRGPDDAPVGVRLHPHELVRFDPATSNDQNILAKFIRSEQATPGSGLLTHLGKDLQKLGTNIAGLNDAAQKALIAQGIEWYYWQSTSYTGQEFLTVSNGVLQYTTARGDGFDGALN